VFVFAASLLLRIEQAANINVVMIKREVRKSLISHLRIILKTCHLNVRRESDLHLEESRVRSLESGVKNNSNSESKS
jgi:hypothetical protein